VLPTALKLTKYTGVDQIAGRQRFALEYGPFLMAALGAADAGLLLMLASGQPADLIGRLRPDRENRSHFDLLASDIKLIPYLEVGNQPFSCFPIIESRAGIFPSET
jgi:hypothetical protein